MTFCDEMAADRLSQLRADLKEEAERRGVKLSYMPLLVKVITRRSFEMCALVCHIDPSSLLCCVARITDLLVACGEVGWSGGREGGVYS